jgi:dipeptidyl aminopeptidase/acylaminoacyl peptidase
MQSKLALVNIKTKKTKTFFYTENHPVYHPIFSPDGQWIAFGSSLVVEKGASMLSKDADIFSQICVISLQTEKVRCLSNTFNQNPIPFGWNCSGTEIFAFDVYKTDGIQIYKLNINSKILAEKMSVTNGYIDPSTLTINRDRSKMSYVYETVSTPPEIFTTSTSQFQPRQVSHVQKKQNSQLGSAWRIQWSSTNGALIDGLLITPPGYDSKKAYPLLVALHGGPPETWFKRYLGGTIHRGKITAPFCLECILKQGFIVLEPNPRGSAYGKNFALSILGDIGGKDYQDIMAGVDFLIQKKIADPNHLAIWGWSYGGYLVPWIISQTHRFKAAVEGAGYCDLISYAGTTDIPQLLTEYLGSPFWKDSRLYLQRSTIMRVNNIQTPLLILHGDKDTRIPISQAYELYTALHEQNKTVKMLRMMGQGHLPDDPAVILEGMKQTNAWLGKVL